MPFSLAPFIIVAPATQKSFLFLIQLLRLRIIRIRIVRNRVVRVIRNRLKLVEQLRIVVERLQIVHHCRLSRSGGAAAPSL